MLRLKLQLKKLNHTIRASLFPALILIASLSHSNAQDNSSNTVRLKKHERIYLAAYDDTTRALATLFLVKRHKIIGPPSPTELERYVVGFNLKATWITFGISSAVLAAGLFMINQNTDSAQEGDMSFIIPMAGAMIMISSGITLTVQYILLTPYTVRKYFKLIDIYATGGKLPRNYTKRMAKYLR